MTRRNEETIRRTKDIEEMMDIGMKNVDIAHKTLLTEGYISRLRDRYNKKLEKENSSPIVYLEYIDHGVLDEGATAYNTPLLACIGQIIEEDATYFYIRQTWSKSLHKNLRLNMVIKSDIKKRIQLGNLKR